MNRTVRDPGTLALRILLALRKFVLTFALICLLVTCSFLLFLRSMALDPLLVRENAWLTFLNILLLTALLCILDSIRRAMVLKRPVRQILRAMERIQAGDFSVRIAPLHGGRHVDEFDAIIDGINRMTQELAGVETLRTDFVASVSHELKTPLAVIKNDAAMLCAPGLTEEARQAYARAIAGTSQRLAELITNILRLNKLENQQIYPNAADYDLGEQLCECLLAFEESFTGKRLDIHTGFEDGVVIHADAELLSLVWNNLFSNAIKFTPPGGRIGVTLTREADFVAVCVSDTGCGMSPDVGRHIFEKFYQGDASHTAQGNGLGLALVRRVIDILGGEISVVSHPGEGSAFTVRLPMPSMTRGA